MTQFAVNEVKGRRMEFSRREQLNSATNLLGEHERFGEALRKARQTRDGQTSQLRGLYEETDKLTKSKSIVPPSDLLVGMVNTQISDAKALIFRDVYLDRLKLFIPAGNNPSYPDLLLSLRVLQEALGRFSPMLSAETDRYFHIVTQLATIVAALKVAEQDELGFENENALDDDSADIGEDGEDEEEAEEEEEEEEEEEDEEADEEEDDDETAEEDEDEEEPNEDQQEEYYEQVLKSQVQVRVKGQIADEWFRRQDGEWAFNFAKLDGEKMPSYQPPRDGITFVLDEK